LSVRAAADQSTARRRERRTVAEGEQLAPALAAGQTASRLDPPEQQPRRHGFPKQEVRGCVGLVGDSLADLSPPRKYAGLLRCSRDVIQTGTQMN